MEILDIVDENGIPTGEVIDRTTAHAKGIRHRTAHVWIVRKNNGVIEALFQKRSKEKESYPLKYDTSSAGHIPSKSEPIDSAIRELSEELGLNVDKEDLKYIGNFSCAYDKVFNGKSFKENEYSYVYIYTKDININNLKLQKEEVESVMWYDFDKAYEERTKGLDVFCAPIDAMNLVKEFLKKYQL